MWCPDEARVKYRVTLGTLWAMAGALIVASLVVMYQYAEITIGLRRQQAAEFDESPWQLAQALYLAFMPLMASGLLVALVALVVHAVLWRRRHTTPDTPSP
jgi:hypothetical protein